MYQLLQSLEGGEVYAIEFRRGLEHTADWSVQRLRAECVDEGHCRREDIGIDEEEKKRNPEAAVIFFAGTIWLRRLLATRENEKGKLTARYAIGCSAAPFGHIVGHGGITGKSFCSLQFYWNPWGVSIYTIITIVGRKKSEDLLFFGSVVCGKVCWRVKAVLAMFSKSLHFASVLASFFFLVLDMTLNCLWLLVHSIVLFTLVHCRFLFAFFFAFFFAFILLSLFSFSLCSLV